VVLIAAAKFVDRRRGQPLPEPLAWTIGICLASLAWAWRADLQALWLN
jgi:hypothetical protein